MRGFKSRLNVSRRHGPSVTRLVTRRAATSVRAEVLEERILGGVGWTARVEIRKTALWVGKFLHAKHYILFVIVGYT